MLRFSYARQKDDGTDRYVQITFYYGREEYDKWHVGHFRRFGDLDYEMQFSPYFTGKVHFGTDTATGMRVGWFLGFKNETQITAPPRGKAFIRHLLPTLSEYLNSKLKKPKTGPN